ncbi:hypothetical protein DLAC_01305 [Tieghemostelium lacteum]|uniref:Uncharacterized protein n=1 Tax=Tieghemostelium lacteum TaxID=361077 RepID=A0A152A8D2_TIELA|nr:hypothetical protein DLAC_01305 [Tieghemostelium lacteum]|eukprot:KYR02464.1 hypothetical protein DLAC_01305 [Tieghemostelium lacteum]
MKSQFSDICNQYESKIDSLRKQIETLKKESESDKREIVDLSDKYAEKTRQKRVLEELYENVKSKLDNGSEISLKNNQFNNQSTISNSNTLKLPTKQQSSTPSSITNNNKQNMLKLNNTSDKPVSKSPIPPQTLLSKFSQSTNRLSNSGTNNFNTIPYLNPVTPINNNSKLNHSYSSSKSFPSPQAFPGKNVDRFSYIQKNSTPPMNHKILSTPLLLNKINK